MLPTRHIIALNGPSNSGKDTLAAMLVSGSRYTRMSFGDFLRQDIVQATPGLDAVPEDERTPLPQHGGQTFKELMLSHGSQVALSDPFRYCRKLAAQVRNSEAKAIVITDMRKPIELRTVLSLKLPVYLIRLTGNEQGNEQVYRLDNLLTSHNHAQFHRIRNDGSPAEMLIQLRDIMEREVPVNFLDETANYV